MLLSAQNLFDKISTHLLTQKKQSKVGAICKYRSGDNLKCAIGCLIPNRLYKPEYEILAIQSLPYKLLMSMGIIESGYKYNHQYLGTKEIALTTKSDVNLLLCIRLQKLHDTYKPIAWKSGLKRIAKEFDLEFNPL